jgi:hypothetical protein
VSGNDFMSESPVTVLGAVLATTRRYCLVVDGPTKLPPTAAVS